MYASHRLFSTKSFHDVFNEFNFCNKRAFSVSGSLFALTPLLAFFPMLKREEVKTSSGGCKVLRYKQSQAVNF